MRDTRPALRVGISSCLLGEPVRFDGGHKRDRFLAETLAPFVEWVPVCPEAEAGFGTPREPMRLVRTSGTPGGANATIRLVTARTGVDLTRPLLRYAARRVAALVDNDLSGYVFKKDSPSCGVARVKVYRGADAGSPDRSGRGLFAARVLRQLPDLPVEEEGRLGDPVVRANFVERMCAYRRLRTLFDRRWRDSALAAFHAAHELVLSAHTQAAYKTLGRLVAHVGAVPAAQTRRRYQSAFMAALSMPATRRTHAGVLQRMVGVLAPTLDPASRAELLDTLTCYRKRLVSLSVPLALIRHHVACRGVTCLAGQIYLEPSPVELVLRDQI